MPRIDQNRPMPMPKGTAGDVVERERSYYDGGDFTRGSAARARRLIERLIGEFNSFPELFELFELFDARNKNVLDYGCGQALARQVLALDERVLTRYPRMCKYARVTFLRFRT